MPFVVIVGLHSLSFHSSWQVPTQCVRCPEQSLANVGDFDGNSTAVTDLSPDARVNGSVLRRGFTATVDTKFAQQLLPDRCTLGRVR